MNKIWITMLLVMVMLGTFCAASSQNQTGDIVEIGRYEQDNDLSNGPESIEWQVLTVESSRMLLVSKHGLDVIRYHSDFNDITWENAEIRSWLNGTFYETAFSDSEKSQILLTTVNNSANPYTGVNGGSDTEDRIFLLSITEAEQYLSNDDARKCEPSQYTVMKGAQVENNYGWWWLRTPGGAGFQASLITSSGLVGTLGDFVMTQKMVRPALWMAVSDEPSSADEPEHTPRAPMVYIVQEGDTCEGLVAEYNLNQAYFLSVNHLTECTVQPGQMLIIPGEDDPQTIAPTQTPEPVDNAAAGKAAYEEGDYKTALPYLTEAAKDGDAESQYLLGLMYQYSRGVTRSYETALEYYQMAADQGHAEAQNKVGFMYFNGRGCKQDYSIAFKYFSLSANQGVPDAQKNLGVMYEYGYGVEKSYTSAEYWYQLAADQGNEAAIRNLEALHEKMEQQSATPVPPAVEPTQTPTSASNTAISVYLQYLMTGNAEAALEQLQPLANSGDAEAQYYIGNIYASKYYSGQSYETAAQYYQMAADQGYEDAINALAELEASGLI